MIKIADSAVIVAGLVTVTLAVVAGDWFVAVWAGIAVIGYTQLLLEDR